MRAGQVAARFGRLRLGGLDRARGESLEHVLDDVLGRQPLDQLGLLQPDGGLVRDRAQELRVLVVERPLVRDADEEAELLVARGQRRDQQLVLHCSASPAPHHRHQLRRARRAVGAVGRIGSDEVELVGVGIDAPDLARVGADQLAGAARDRVVEILAQRDRGERLAELRQRGQRVDPPARSFVELRVLDRARHQRRGVHQKVEHAVVELARGLGMENDHTHYASVAWGEHRHCDHRLELLLLELGHVLHARVAHRVVADELRRLRARDPPGEPLVDAPAQRADQVRVALRGGAQLDAIPLHEIDEGRVAVRRVGGDLHDPVEHPAQVERGGDGLDDRVERLVLALDAGLSVATTSYRGHRQSEPSSSRAAMVTAPTRAPYVPFSHSLRHNDVLIIRCGSV